MSLSPQLETSLTLETLVAQIVANYVSNNTVPMERLPILIEEVTQSVRSIGGGGRPPRDARIDDHHSFKSNANSEDLSARALKDSDAATPTKLASKKTDDQHAGEPASEAEAAAAPQPEADGPKTVTVKGQVKILPTEPVGVPMKEGIELKDAAMLPDWLICLNDGKRMKTLKRHLKSGWNQTPEEYRAYWGLPEDYPMVAPNYSQKRTELALASKLGVGRKKKVTA